MIIINKLTITTKTTTMDIRTAMIIRITTTAVVFRKLNRLRKKRKNRVIS